MSTPHGNGYLEPSAREEETKNELNFKETELRLGLPGLDSPERKKNNGVSLFGKDLKEEAGNNNGFAQSPLKDAFVSSGKRGFYEAAIDENNKWGLSVSNRYEVEMAKKDALFSSGGTNVDNSSSGLKSCLNGNSAKEEVSNASPAKPFQDKKNEIGSNNGPASKAQVVGWPPVRSFRKNAIAANPSKDNEKSGPSSCLYVKVSMDGAPYLRKIDLKLYTSYAQLSSALEKMFSCFTIGQCGQGVAEKDQRLSESHLMDLLHGSEYVLTYEDKDGDWMLVGDVPWEMFTESCKRMRNMKGSDAIGLAPRATQKAKSQK